MRFIAKLSEDQLVRLRKVATFPFALRGLTRVRSNRRPVDHCYNRNCLYLLADMSEGIEQRSTGNLDHPP